MEKPNDTVGATTAEATTDDQWAKISQTTTAEARAVLIKNYAKIDKDNNGYLTVTEIDGYMQQVKPTASTATNESLKFFRDKVGRLQNFSNDEWFTENNGISKKDLTMWAKGAHTNLELEEWAMWTADALKNRGSAGSQAAASEFIEFATTIDPDSRKSMLQRFDALNYADYSTEASHLRTTDILNVTWADLNKDGKKDEIKDAKLHTATGCTCARCGGTRDTIDVYDP